MRALILFFVLIYCFQIESLTVCDKCTCEQKSEPFLVGLVVNCSLNEIVPDVNAALPDAAVILDLSGSNLTSIEPTRVFESKTLVEILLNRNYLREINLNSSQLPELKRLDLSENELETLSPNLFNGFTKLEYLNLANNKFTSGSQLNFKSLVSLKEIILDNNNIGGDLETRSLLDTEGFGLPLSIQSISISGVNLQNLNLEYFKPVHKTLRRLILSNNNLTIFVKLPQNLEYLDYSNNPIRNITSDNFPWLTPLLYLRELKLNNLDIEEVPKNVFLNVMLTHLELKYNKKLKLFSHLAFGRQLLTDTYDFYVENLSLRGSNISTLDKALSVLFVRVKKLDLQQNPLTCDCRLAWIRKLPIIPDFINDLRCNSPQHLNDTRIFDLEEEDFVCPKSWWDEFGIGVEIGLGLFLLLVLLTSMCIYIFLYNPATKIIKPIYSHLK